VCGQEGADLKQLFCAHRVSGNGPRTRAAPSDGRWVVNSACTHAQQLPGLSRAAASQCPEGCVKVQAILCRQSRKRSLFGRGIAVAAWTQRQRPAVRRCVPRYSLWRGTGHTERAFCVELPGWLPPKPRTRRSSQLSPAQPSPASRPCVPPRHSGRGSGAAERGRERSPVGSAPGPRLLG